MSNVEATARGIAIPNDKDYEEGVFAVTKDEKEAYNFNKPLSNSECLGDFLMTRSACLRNMKRFDEEADALTQASRYLSDKPLMKERMGNTVRRAINDSNAERWDVLWNKVDKLSIPDAMKFEQVYLENRKYQVRYFMNNSTNLWAIEMAINDLTGELAEYQTQIALSHDSPKISLGQRQLLLKITAPSGKKVPIPVELLPPPLDRGGLTSLPPYLKRVEKLDVEDMDSILAVFWKYYGELNQSPMEPVLMTGKIRSPPRIPMPSDLPLTQP